MELPSDPLIPAPTGLAGCLPSLLDRLPSWVGRLSGGAPRVVADDTDVLVAIDSGRDVALIGGCVRRASMREARDLRDRVAALYALLLDEARALAMTPLRWWNFIPGIDAPAGRGLNRYMVFNAGRHAAYAPSADRCGGSAPIATASAVGTCGDELYVGMIAGCEPGVPVENPRQVPAYRYSARYGPRPPCFARATLAPALGVLFVGGTASVCGEDSVHVGCIAGQLDESIRNVHALLGAGLAGSGPADTSRPLTAFATLRAYVVRREDTRLVRTRLADAGAPGRVDIVHARLCRPELLVEVEGVVPLGARPASRWTPA
jgi:hypothetical protein